MENRTPTFCSVCGSRLVPDSEIQGYDVYTGLPVSSAELYCNNPTVEVSGSFFNKRTATINHPSWAEVDGVWEQS